jgi:hypothetical protein
MISGLKTRISSTPTISEPKLRRCAAGAAEDSAPRPHNGEELADRGKTRITA